MRTLKVQVIPHEQQRYNTAGDYFTDVNGVEQFRISLLSENKFEHLAMIHEIVERVLTFHAGVTNEAVDEFDISFEKRRATEILGEPGDDPTAPYYRMHQIATIVERIVAAELGVDWHRYELALNDL